MLTDHGSEYLYTGGGVSVADPRRGLKVETKKVSEF